jgi:uncharacterized protein (TIGR02246 family)
MTLNDDWPPRGRRDPAPPADGCPLPAEPGAGWTTGVGWTTGAGWTTGYGSRDGALERAGPGPGGPPAPEGSMADGSTARTTIDGLVHLLVNAWNRHDAAAFAAGFAEDVEFTDAFGLTVYGRAAIEAAHAAIFRTAFKDSTLTAADTRVRFVRADVAAVDLCWELTGARGPEGHAGPERHGLMTMVATEQAGAWRFTICHNQDLPPPGHLAKVTGPSKGRRG